MVGMMALIMPSPEKYAKLSNSENAPFLQLCCASLLFISGLGIALKVARRSHNSKEVTLPSNSPPTTQQSRGDQFREFSQNSRPGRHKKL